MKRGSDVCANQGRHSSTLTPHLHEYHASLLLIWVCCMRLSWRCRRFLCPPVCEYVRVQACKEAGRVKDAEKAFAKVFALEPPGKVRTHTFIHRRTDARARARRLMFPRSPAFVRLHGGGCVSLEGICDYLGRDGTCVCVCVYVCVTLQVNVAAYKIMAQMKQQCGEHWAAVTLIDKALPATKDEQVRMCLCVCHPHVALSVCRTLSSLHPRTPHTCVCPISPARARARVCVCVTRKSAYL